MDDLGMALFALGSIVWVILAVVAVIGLLFWVLFCAMAMKFCNACGHSHAGLVWVPVPGVANIVMLQSLTLSGAVYYPGGLVYGLCGVTIAGVVLSWVPFVGQILAGIGCLTAFISGIMMWIGGFKVSRMIGRGGVMFLVLYALLPISIPFLWNGLANGIIQYADSTYA